jgi:hypothetical protein
MKPILTLADLPPAPANRTGWPWTEESPASTLAHHPDEMQWPEMTLVTPSFNQAAYLEETIRSVLLQGYPRLQYIVVDGGSTDGSVEIIQRYAPFLDHWISEPDHGQTDAIRKGLALATGEIFNWLCSDDILYPGALRQVGRVWAPDRVVYGLARFIDEHGRDLGTCPGQTRHMTWDKLLRFGSYYLIQPSAFLPTWDVVAAGGPEQALHYVMDWDLYTRMKTRTYTCVPGDLVGYRLHQTSKTFSQADRFVQDVEVISARLAATGVLAGPQAKSLASLFAGRTYLMPNVRQPKRGLKALAQAVREDPFRLPEAVGVAAKGLLRPAMGERAWALARDAQARIRG